MRVIDFDPSEGMARQGDIIIWRLPHGFKLDTAQKIQARDGRLILAEGEMSGHHHSILDCVFNPPQFRDDAMAHSAESCFRPTVGVASLYRDDDLTERLTKGYLTASTLCIGYLRVEDAPILLEHQEHDAIRIPPGTYYIGRQQEYNAGELRRVAD